MLAETLHLQFQIGRLNRHLLLLLVEVVVVQTPQVRPQAVVVAAEQCRLAQLARQMLPLRWEEAENLRALQDHQTQVHLAEAQEAAIHLLLDFHITVAAVAVRDQ
jgi:hypothetical protein